MTGTRANYDTITLKAILTIMLCILFPDRHIVLQFCVTYGLMSAFVYLKRTTGSIFWGLVLTTIFLFFSAGMLDRGGWISIFASVMALALFFGGLVGDAFSILRDIRAKINIDIHLPLHITERCQYYAYRIREKIKRRQAEAFIKKYGADFHSSYYGVAPSATLRRQFVGPMQK